MFHAVRLGYPTTALLSWICPGFFNVWMYPGNLVGFYR